MKVGGVMTRQIEIAAPDETLQKAASRMAELDTGVLPVGEGDQIELVNLAALIDDAKCFALVRQHRWPEGVRCPGCGSDAVVRHGRNDTRPQRQRYR